MNSFNSLISWIFNLPHASKTKQQFNMLSCLRFIHVSSGYFIIRFTITLLTISFLFFFNSDVCKSYFQRYSLLFFQVSKRNLYTLTNSLTRTTAGKSEWWEDLNSREKVRHTFSFLLALSVLLTVHILGERSLRWRPDSAGFLRSITNHLGVNSARYAVVQFCVKFGQNIRVVAGSIRNITNGSGLDDVSDYELLDGLILWDASGTVGTTHGLDVAAVALAASSITPLLSHFRDRLMKEPRK